MIKNKIPNSFLILLTVTLIFVCVSGQASDNWSPRSPLNYKSSIHSTIIDPSEDGVERTITKECTEAIRKHIGAGKNFSSNIMEQEFTLPISGTSDPEIQNGEFFHYTKAEIVSALVRKKDFESIFGFLKTRQYSSEWYLYIAADPKSSKEFGHIQVKIYLPPTAKIYTSNGPAKSMLSASTNSSDLAVEAELVRKFPNLSVCHNQGLFAYNGHFHPILTSLAAEANGISLIAYYGRDGGWYQLTGPWAFDSMVLGN